MKRGWIGRSVIGTGVFVALGGAAQAGELKVVVTGVKSNEGQVHAMVCTEAQWLKVCPLDANAPAKAGTTVVTIPNVPPGKYGVIASHDKNRNGKTDQNFIGMPTEDVGFSNDALKGLSKPKFAVAAFDQPATGSKTITLKLNDFSK
jgi:uncharacterized protein (DUF2141 family)